MTRDDLVEAVTRACAGHAAVLFVGNGSVARSVATLHDRDEVFYMVGSMGLCSSIAAGFCHARRRPVVALEGDANLLMGMSGLPAVARATRGRTFVHVVADNGQCETTGGQRTVTDGVDVERLAAACGYERSARCEDADDVTVVLDQALTEGGSWMLHAPVVPGTSPKHARVPQHPREITRRFRDAVLDPVSPGASAS